jgi:hypothetical protein
MTLDIDEAKVNRNEFGLWLGWTLATMIGMILGYLPLALVVGPIDLGIALVVVPIVSGILLGLAQWLVLRSYVTNSQDWIINLVGAWVVGYALGLLVVNALSRTAVGTLIGFIVFGIIVAIFQYPVLRREIPHIGSWILANVVGWTLGAYLSQLAAGIFFQNTLPTTISAVLVSVGITGLVAGAIIGLALVWIVRQPDRATV